MTQVKRAEPGSVEIRKLVLNTGVGAPVPLVGIGTQIDIYESIFQPYIIAEIIIVDSIGLLNKFPQMKETGSVSIEIGVPGFQQTVKYELGIFDIVGTRSDNQDKLLVYKLVCISKELDKPEAHKTVRYSGKENLADTVINVLKTYIKTDKEYVCEPTNGIINVKQSNIKPFELIDLVRQSAMSVDNESHSYVFYEDKYGYKFVTIEKLIEDGVKKIGDKIYTYDSAVNVDVEGTNWRNILYRDVIKMGHGIEQLLLNAARQKIVQHTLQTNQYETIEKDARDLNFKKLDKDGFTSTTERQTALQDIVTHERAVTVLDENEDDLYVSAEKIAHLSLFVPDLVSNISRILVYGDPALTVGEVIKCDIPDVDGLTKKKTKLSPTQSGNYLVTKLRHMIDLAAPPTYTQSMELVKTGFGEGKPF